MLAFPKSVCKPGRWKTRSLFSYAFAKYVSTEICHVFSMAWVFLESQVLGIQSSSWHMGYAAWPHNPEISTSAWYSVWSDWLLYYRKHFTHMAIFTAPSHIFTILYIEYLILCKCSLKFRNKFSLRFSLNCHFLYLFLLTNRSLFFLLILLYLFWKQYICEQIKSFITLKNPKLGLWNQRQSEL